MVKYTVRLEKSQPSGEFSRCLEYICFSDENWHSTIFDIVQKVAHDTSGRLYLLKIFDDRCQYYRELKLDCHLQLSELFDFLQIL